MKKKKAELLETEDGSPTIYLADYDEAMHSSHGAYSESLIKHVVPSGLLQKEGPLSVLDIGFGMGYNVLALFASLAQEAPGRELEIISLEMDNYYGELLEKIHFGDERDAWYTLVRKAFTEGEVSEGSFKIRVLFGDARETIEHIPDYYADAVFQDPFSPAHNPELWNVEYFRKMKRIMKPDGVMTTYSGALHVRQALLDAGFIIGRGPGMGKKREGTIASPGPVIASLSEDEIKAVKENIKSTPYRDLSGYDSRDEILKRRLEEMAQLRAIRDRQVLR